MNTTNILPQTTFWERVKRNQGFITKALELTASKNLLLDNAGSSEKKVKICSS